MQLGPLCRGLRVGCHAAISVRQRGLGVGSGGHGRVQLPRSCRKPLGEFFLLRPQLRCLGLKLVRITASPLRLWRGKMAMSLAGQTGGPAQALCET